MNIKRFNGYLVINEVNRYDISNDLRRDTMLPKYKIVIEEIKSWLFKEQFLPHDKLPTETQLMDKFNVSRHTIRRAIGDLEVANYLYRIQGGGYSLRIGRINGSIRHQRKPLPF